MSNALATRSLPSAIGALPAPVEATPGTYIVITASADADHPWASPPPQAHVGPTVWFEQQLTPVSPWRVLSNYSTALRAHKGRKSGWWITPSSDAAELKLRQELDSYGRLDANSDGKGATAQSQAVKDAFAFLDSRPTDIPLPYPEEGTEGDVGVYWDNSHAHVFAEVIFEGDGTCAYFAVHGVPGAVREKCGKDGVDVSAPWPDDMLRLLRIQESA